jgi:hypothetical protein
MLMLEIAGGVALGVFAGRFAYDFMLGWFSDP